MLSPAVKPLATESKKQQRRRLRLRRFARRLAELECRWQLRNRCLSTDAAGAAAMFGLTAREWLKRHAAGDVPPPIRIGRNPVWNLHELAAWLVADAPPREVWNLQRAEALKASTVTPQQLYHAVEQTLFGELTGTAPTQFVFLDLPMEQ